MLDALAPPDAPAPRHRWPVAGVAVLLGLWGYARWRANPAVFDDAFISFRYAHNLVVGNGLVFNPGERVEGYTNFLWTLLAALGIGLGWEPLAITRGVGVAAYLGTILIAVGAVGFQIRRARELAALGVFALLVLPITYPAFAGTGLETSFVGLLLLLTGLAQQLWPRRDGWRRWLGGVPPLLAVLTRLDAGIVLAASVLVIAMAERHSWAGLRARLLPALLPSALGLGLLFGWRLAYYGDLLPNPYYAKAAYLTSFALGVEYLFGFLRSCPVSLVLLGLTLYGARAAPEMRGRDFARFAVLACGAQVGFVAKVGGDFMEYRLLWELWPVLVTGAGVGALALVRSHLWVAVALVAGALAMARTPVVLESVHTMQSVAEMDGIARRSAQVGKLLASTLPPETRIATTAAGLGYHALDLRVLDQWGLTDRTVAHLPVSEIRARGHVKLAPPEYLAARLVNLQFDHPKLTKCSNPRRKQRAQVFIRLGEDDECVSSFYLTQTPTLTRLFCAHPERFVIQRVDCPAP